MVEGKRLVIANACALTCCGLKATVQDGLGVHVVGEASNGIIAQDLCRRLRPDLLLVDCALPLVDGHLLARLMRLRDNVGRIGLVCSCGGRCLEQAMAEGVEGFVVKEASAEELCFAVRSILEGGLFVSPCVASRLVRICREHWHVETRPPEGWRSLTPRERDILRLVAEGHRNKDIAALLIISEKTVEKHRANFMSKLALHSRHEVRRFAESMGMPLREGRQ